MIQNEIIEKYSEMTMEEREFLVQTLESSKPKKILEVGIAAGANSVIILDYLDKTNQIDNIELHSCDYNTKYYRDIITPPPPAI
ncbi:hypothetical protein CQA53_05560 [Helicobacter didelphidarum]|uniref:Class I SAM-dependent methyltransferase n=1 Tax=Helicobacter didelphidarum TaxID=2040648 RepID=A0A3D8IL41_9HELI|nr:hypothetical protein [Helicobacter didelphidarum]RDU65908.1 hypothetical protein CQA53_05560 [Helicobacter didelphidarum]